MQNLLLLITVCLFIFGCGRQPVANFTWSPSTPKTGDTVQFTNLSTDAKSYSWNFGDMSIVSDVNPSHVYANAGDYIIDLTAHRGLKSDTKTITITVTN